MGVFSGDLYDCGFAYTEDFGVRSVCLKESLVSGQIEDLLIIS